MKDEIDWKSLLAVILNEHDCQTGTIHQMEASGTHLGLVCQIGVPEGLVEKITRIPIGKGIAGVAAERREPVMLCNLQQDLGGVARANARQTGVSGSLAVPVFNADRTKVLGILGVGKLAPHDFPAEEIRRVESHAAAIGRRFEMP
ncbi:MAG: GAF domain-containing protein [Akkermansiaceae bacterium]|nr:GAF domain-containing protein [Akkermansiaceae bacterium]